MAGSVAQTVWNDLHNRPLWENIKDVDIVYFDKQDLSLKTELENENKANSANFGLKIDLKNQARVHMWYESCFGYSIKPYKSIEEAIKTWPTTATSITIKLDNSEKFKIYAPYGLDDLFNLTVRANKTQITKQIFEAKTSRWIKIWPKLKIIPWDLVIP